jgi:hypothetical protein
MRTFFALWLIVVLFRGLRDSWLFCKWCFNKVMEWRYP